MSDADVDFFTPLAKQKEATKSTAKASAPMPNNPGNLRPVGSSSGFQQFATPEEGISAADKNLQAYGKKGVNTLRGVISRWAPPSENDTETYINTVAKKIGLDPDAKIDLNNPVQRHIISGAMFTVEKGSKNLFKTEEHPDVSFFKPLAKSEPVVEKPIEDKAAFGIYPRMAGSRQTIEARQPPSFKDIPAEAPAKGDVVDGAPSAIIGNAV